MTARPTLLIVEDEPNQARMLAEYFGLQGYGVQTVAWGLEAVNLCWENPPQLALLDVHLPDITGYDIAQRLRTNRRTRDIPVIFLTNRSGRQDRLRGLQLGAIDYIAKPFDLQELELRVRNALQRQQWAEALYHPVTGLPEGRLVDEHLEALADAQAAVVVSIQQLDAFRETYGFMAAAEVLRAASLKLCRVAESGPPVDFLGQLEASQFLVMTVLEHLEAVSAAISSELGPDLDYFYPLDDRPEPGAAGRHLEVRLTRLTPADITAAGSESGPAALRHLLTTVCQ